MSPTVQPFEDSTAPKQEILSKVVTAGSQKRDHKDTVQAAFRQVSIDFTGVKHTVQSSLYPHVAPRNAGERSSVHSQSIEGATFSDEEVLSSSNIKSLIQEQTIGKIASTTDSREFGSSHVGNTLSLVFPNSLQGSSVQYRRLPAPVSLNKFARHAKFKIKKLKPRNSLHESSKHGEAQALVNRRDS